MKDASLPEFIQGESGHIEYDFIPAKALEHESSLIAIVCHPHPLHGGSKDNKVVHTLCRACRDLGVDSLRFNFRGVGNSEGSFDDGRGELEDLIAVLRFVRKELSAHKKILLAGFSFGAFIAASYAAANKPSALILVAPPVQYPEFNHLKKFVCPVLIVQGDADEIVVTQDVRHWSDQLDAKCEFALIEGAGHFFHGKLTELKSTVEAFIDQC